MAFQSFQFLLFLIVTFFVVNVFLKDKESLKKTYLLLASYYFYMCWDWRFSGLLFFITLVNYYFGPKIYHEKNRKYKIYWLWASLILSLLVLVYFKYANFFIESFQSFLKMFGISQELPLLNVILPVGISFYTFQSISYVLDIYQGRIQPVHSFRDFALFVAFFPQLVAGPIVRASHFLPQLRGESMVEDNAIDRGTALIIRGYIKKVMFADVLGLHIVDPAFAFPEKYSPIFLIIALYGYTYQVYMDFSGYTDIARGVAKTLGYELQINFNRPYKAKSVSEFWQRWHISMSSFFRDYLYFGVGGSKYGNVYVNLFITFIAIGIWHGAGWNFVVYGICHGAMVSIERVLRNRRKRLNLPEKQTKLRQFGSIFITFNFVVFARILFRCGTLTGAYEFVKALFSFDNIGEIPTDYLGYAVLIIAFISHYVPDRWTYEWKDLYARFPYYVQGILMVLMIYTVVAFTSGEAPFIYFQF